MYKIIFISIMLSLSLYPSVMADDSIDIKIAALQKATPTERVALMNTIKIELSKMNVKERSVAIAHLRKKRGAIDSNTDNNIHDNNMILLPSIRTNIVNYK